MEEQYCDVCGHPLAEGYTRKTCPDCVRRRSNYAKRVHEEAALHLCSICHKNPHEPGKALCASCLESLKQKAYSLHKERHDAHLCIYCGCILSSNSQRKVCESCLEKRHSTHKEQKHESRDKGFCVQCRKRVPIEGSKLCAECVEKIRMECRATMSGPLCDDCSPQTIDYHRCLRKRANHQGLCVLCKKNPCEKGKTCCASCLEKQRTSHKELWQGRRAQHLCVVCGTPLAEDEHCKTCEKCRGYMKSYRQARYEKAKQEGLCSTCGKRPPVEGKRRCSVCIEKARLRSQRAKEALKNSELL